MVPFTVCRGFVSDGTGASAFAQVESAGGLAGVESTEGIGLECVHPLDGVLMAQPAIVDCVVKPEKLNRAVLGQ